MRFSMFQTMKMKRWKDNEFSFARFYFLICSCVRGTRCDPSTCPVDCVYNDWSAWTLCPVTCGHLERQQMTADASDASCVEMEPVGANGRNIMNDEGWNLTPGNKNDEMMWSRNDGKPGMLGPVTIANLWNVRVARLFLDQKLIWVSVCTSIYSILDEHTYFC